MQNAAAVTTPSLFVPPRPPIPAVELGWLRFLSTVRSNAIGLWPTAAYEQDVLAQSFLGRRSFLINAPDAIHRVLIENAVNYRRSPASVRILRPIVGNGLVLSEGDEWKHQRRTIAPALAPRVMPMLARHVADVAQETVARLAAALGQAVDLLALMQNLALEIAARSMFSLEMREHGAALRRLIAEFGERLGRPYLLDMLLPPAIPNLRDLARRRFRKRWLTLMDEIVARRLRAAPSETPRDLFDLLRAARDPETGAAFSPDQLRDQVATMIVAGHETTAVAMFWALYLLTAAPSHQERVAEEARTVDLSAAAAGDALPCLAYARAVVNETLRLYPPAHVMARQAIGPDRLRDLAVPPGSVIMISPWVLHRHRRLWSNPDMFDPARFLDGAPLAHRFAYLPFGAGPRVCVGAQFALAEATLVLATLMRRFRVVGDDDAPIFPVAVVTTQPDRPARFRFEPRDA